MKDLNDEHICRLVRTCVVDANVAPGAVAGVAIHRNGRWRNHVGYAGTHDPFDRQPVALDTVYDLASLTKPMVAFGFARAVELGACSFHDPIVRWLPSTVGSPLESVSLSSLLEHRSGLPAHLELYAPLRDGGPFDRALAISAIVRSGRVYESRPAAEYSDLGYILVGEALEAATKTELDVWLKQQFTDAGIFNVWSARQLPEDEIPFFRVAPTEVVAYRGGLVRGQVHDDNAWALNGLGCSGHAGLFATVHGVLAFAKAMLDVHAERSAHLSVQSRQLLLSRRTDASLRAGFDGKGKSGSSIGSVMSDETFGHLGFTGTSFWCDPELDLAVVLLTNRVCPSRDNILIRQARPLIHDQLALLALSRSHS